MERGTSNAPLILGIIGAVVSLPNLVCASVCGAIAGAATGGESGAAIGAWLGVVPIVLGFIAAFFGKSKPTFCGISMLICALISFITVILTGFVSIFGWAAFILFLIAGIIAFTQTKEKVTV